MVIFFPVISFGLNELYSLLFTKCQIASEYGVSAKYLSLCDYVSAFWVNLNSNFCLSAIKTNPLPFLWDHAQNSRTTI